jgi:hypothetical protein
MDWAVLVTEETTAKMMARIIAAGFTLLKMLSMASC